MGLFKAKKPNDEKNNANEHNMVKISTGRRQTRWLFTSMIKELSGRSRTSNCDLWISSPAP